jgi:hypothetical protein
MNAATIFSQGNSFVLLGWILLIFLPKWKFTQTIILHGVVLLLAIVYSILIAQGISEFKPDSFSTLANVKALFQEDNAVAAGWLHYLAFDLFVGAYVVRKSIQLGISRWIYTPILPFCFMFGPVGYLLFFIVKTIKAKSLIDIH